MEILKRCPDAVEQVDNEGKNALPIAAESGSVRALKFLLAGISSEEIVNRADKYGNTHLHLAVKNSRLQSALTLLKDKRADPCILNNSGETPRRIIESSDDMDSDQINLLQKLMKVEKARRYSSQQPLFPTSARTWSPFAKTMPTFAEQFKSRVVTYSVVTALIATGSFAAIFTMPGGYHQQYGYPLLVALMSAVYRCWRLNVNG